ncbi:hypothetical protein NDU88_007011 [Pleurodeles waltl]|uniref:Uncharacterized protein n=1 Tax=Pleurodeles waltl TaxID=8319 RepID=A0AAV7SR46_PLEWA|nr:hypothetical protein NDU88_007011 [Pleurodeles waltl]
MSWFGVGPPPQLPGLAPQLPDPVARQSSQEVCDGPTSRLPQRAFPVVPLLARCRSVSSWAPSFSGSSYSVAVISRRRLSRSFCSLVQIRFAGGFAVPSLMIGAQPSRTP